VGKIARRDFAHADRTERRNVSGEIDAFDAWAKARDPLPHDAIGVSRLCPPYAFACAMNARQLPKAEQSTRCCRPRA